VHEKPWESMSLECKGGGGPARSVQSTEEGGRNHPQRTGTERQGNYLEQKRNGLFGPGTGQMFFRETRKQPVAAGPEEEEKEKVIIAARKRCRALRKI